MKCARGATGYAATTFLSSARLPGEELSEGGTAREGRGGYERGREGEGLMGLSGETVIVRGWWVKPGAGADGWACVPSTRQPGPAVEMVQGGGGAAPPALCLTSAPVIRYTTDRPSERGRTVSRQTAVPRSPRRPPASRAHHFSGWTAPKTASSSDSRRGSDKPRAALQTPFPKRCKTFDSSCLACSFAPCLFRRHLFSER